MASKTLKVLVVDDSSLYRKIVRQSINEIPECEVVDVAYDGIAALDLIKKVQPDLVTLDIEMPRLDGLETLKRIKAEFPKVGVIMLSALTSEGAHATTQALRDGAFDFVLKPVSGSLEANANQIAQELCAKIKAFNSSRTLLNLANKPEPVRKAVARPQTHEAPLCVCLGVSTGGPQALSALLPALPSNFHLPIFIVQHMPPIFTKSLADHLNAQCKLKVCEATDMQAVEKGCIYIAPGGKQMRVQRLGLSATIRVTDDPAEGACKPSVDYLFRSVAEGYGGAAIGVILTGMGQDGLAGCRLLAAKGCRIIAQNQATSTVYGMPRQIVENQLAHDILPLDQIAPKINEIALTKVPLCV